MAQLKGARIAVFDEFDENLKILPKRMKQLANEEGELQVKKLFENSGKINLQCSCFCLMNEQPQIKV